MPRGIAVELLVRYPRASTNSRAVGLIQAEVVGAAVCKVVYAIARLRRTIHVIDPEAPVAGVLRHGGKQLIETTKILALFPGNGVVHARVDLLAGGDFDSRCAADSDGKRGEDKLGDLHDGCPRKKYLVEFKMFER
ncbi:hypothetical protein IFM46972_01720 [Aspergillus udagawae]|uniref:Uncharacterized protein n=1 Tax=Aspergillus udagawae TaxID=91492 RepID=A0A8H3RHI8_9EURO|nr:hypothetical protein IFM46972_01720 [Aspergillus udagawae]